MRTRSTFRPFTRADWLGAIVNCPHCNQNLKVVEVAGPYVGLNPDMRLDRFWILTFSDGARGTMWEYGQGMMVIAAPSNN